MLDTGPLRPARRRGPIFIIGGKGTGTTLLRLMLDSHERIAIPHETGFMRAYNAQRFIPFKWGGRRWAERLGWSHDELDRELGDFYRRLFKRYAAAHGKRRWGEKTPLHTWHVDDMARLFPGAVFIGIVRHPGGAIHSNMRRFDDSAGLAISHWRRYTRELARQAARRRGRFVVLRYEDLVLEPETVMRDLLRWLGEPWSDSVLAHHVVQGARGGADVVEGRSRVDDAIDRSRIDTWTRELRPPLRSAMERDLRDLAAVFGYDVADSAALAPLRADGGLVLSGADVRALVERHAHLHLRERVQPPLADRFYRPSRMHLREGRLAVEQELTVPAALRLLRLALWRRASLGTRQRLRAALRRGP